MGPCYILLDGESEWAEVDGKAWADCLRGEAGLPGLSGHACVIGCIAPDGVVSAFTLRRVVLDRDGGYEGSTTSLSEEEYELLRDFHERDRASGGLSAEERAAYSALSRKEWLGWLPPRRAVETFLLTVRLPIASDSGIAALMLEVGLDPVHWNWQKGFALGPH